MRLPLAALLLSLALLLACSTPAPPILPDSPPDTLLGVGGGDAGLSAVHPTIHLGGFFPFAVPPNIASSGLFLMGVDPTQDLDCTQGIWLTWNHNNNTGGPSITYDSSHGASYKAWDCPPGYGWGTHADGCTQLGSTVSTVGTTITAGNVLWLHQSTFTLTAGHTLYAQQIALTGSTTTNAFVQAE